MRQPAAIAAAAFLLGACASTPSQPTAADQVAGLQQALQQASQRHLEDYAAPPMREARADYARAVKALNAQQAQPAEDAAKEGLLKVQLAGLQAREARARANAMQMQRDIDNLKQAAKLPGDQQ